MFISGFLKGKIRFMGIRGGTTCSHFVYFLLGTKDIVELHLFLVPSCLSLPDNSTQNTAEWTYDSTCCLQTALFGRVGHRAASQRIFLSPSVLYCNGAVVCVLNCTKYILSVCNGIQYKMFSLLNYHGTFRNVRLLRTGCSLLHYQYP